MDFLFFFEMRAFLGFTFTSMIIICVTGVFLSLYYFTIHHTLSFIAHIIIVSVTKVTMIITFIGIIFTIHIVIIVVIVFIVYNTVLFFWLFLFFPSL